MAKINMSLGDTLEITDQRFSEDQPLLNLNGLAGEEVFVPLGSVWYFSDHHPCWHKFRQIGLMEFLLRWVRGDPVWVSR